MDTNDLIYLIGELYVQRREQQMENQKLQDEIEEKDEKIIELQRALESDA